jgi:uncharacterized protein YecT (DUF1311 family)
MKKGLLILIGLLSSILAISQNQASLNFEAEKKLVKNEADLRNVYDQIKFKYQSDKEFVINLKKSQDSWSLYRDAQIRLKFPNQKSGYYGSVYPMCVSIYKAELVQARIKELRQWLDVEEGDVCLGSAIRN